MKYLDYFVSRISIVPHEPKACTNCAKMNLIKNVVEETTGIDTFLCLSCETLMPVTNRNANTLSLKSSVGNNITIRHNAK